MTSEIGLHSLHWDYSEMGEPHKELEILSGWTDIANYLRKGVRTVQRYERELRLPVHRPAGKFRGSVLATKVELDAWIAASPVRRAFRETESDPASSREEFKSNLKQLRQLRLENQVLREELQHSVKLLRQSLWNSPPHFPSDNPLAMPLFDPKKKTN